jgi:hypothetical protein
MAVFWRSFCAASIRDSTYRQRPEPKRGERCRVLARAVVRAGSSRVRGERRRCPSSSRTSVGSSPRARGTRACRSGRNINNRFIPACAGNTAPHRMASCMSLVHPRVRGERLFHSCPAWSAAGSSPRARGTRDMRRKRRGELRFIPACAGNASTVRPRKRRAAVHPRVREERPDGKPNKPLTAGSSPRARGRDAVRKAEEQKGGSSPRARGTLLLTGSTYDSSRFIPACEVGGRGVTGGRLSSPQG